jgi:hypothetical protein
LAVEKLILTLAGKETALEPRLTARAGRKTVIPF